MLPAIGYTLREANAPLLVDADVNALEITFFEGGDKNEGRDCNETQPARSYLAYDLISVQLPQLSPARPEFPSPAGLGQLAQRCSDTRATWLSAPLTPAGDGGPCNAEVLDRCCHNVELIEEHFAPLSFYVENTSSSWRSAGSMSESDFLYELLQRTGCGWLLNLTHVYAGATTFGFDPYEFIAEVIPAAQRVQLRLAGGLREQRHASARAYPIPKPVWALYRHALSLCSEKVTAVFLGRDLSLADEAVWRREVAQIRRIAEDVDASCVYCRKR